MTDLLPATTALSDAIQATAVNAAVSAAVTAAKEAATAAAAIEVARILAEQPAPVPAPVYIADPHRPRRPDDIDPRAMPSEARPSAAVIDATTKAINELGATMECQWFLPGDYWISGTISPSGGSRDRARARKQLYFNSTEIRAVPTADMTSYIECTGQDVSKQSLSGLDDPSDNLPAGVVTRAMFDLWNTDRSDYHGTWLLSGLETPGFCVLASANRYGEDAAGGIGSTWDNLTINKYWCAMFGTPRYGGARNFYTGTFVGNNFRTLNINPSGPYTMILGGNTVDDAFFDTLKVKGAAGARAYIRTCNLNVGSLYGAGRSKSDFIFDLNNSTLKFDTFYAEEHLAAPIIMRNGANIHGICRYGSGPSTDFGLGCFVYDVSRNAGGKISAHPDNEMAPNMQSLVRLKAVAGARRVYDVWQSYPDTKRPFAAESGAALPAGDVLRSMSGSGLAQWSWGGTPSAPILNRLAA